MGSATSIVKRFPHFFHEEDGENTFHRFVGVFGAMIDQGETDLMRVMRAHWVNSADNDGSKGFDTDQKGDLDKIFSLFLENLGGTSLLRQVNRRDGEAGLEDDAVYRNRIHGLIQVLKNGASTKDGIRAIVAANLGILGDDAAADMARSQIFIDEFLPEPQTQAFKTAFFQTIDAENPNPIPVRPQVRLKLSAIFGASLVEISLVNLTTGGRVIVQRGVLPGDEMLFLANGKTLLNGVEIQTVGALPMLPPGRSKWRFEAKLGQAAGVFGDENDPAAGHTFFDFAQFDVANERVFGRFDENTPPGNAGFDRFVFATDEQVVDLDFTIFKFFPASFRVRTPWDSPGFTVRFRLTAVAIEAFKAVKFRPAEPSDWLAGAAISLENLPEKEFDDWSGILKTLAENGVPPAFLPRMLAAIWPFLEAAADKFERLSVNPRSQIPYIVDKVRAAGVLALVNYEKRFFERHDLADHLAQLSITMTNSGQPLENHDLAELNFDLASVQTNQESNDLSDALNLGGVLDFSGFDSLNGFN